MKRECAHTRLVRLTRCLSYLCTAEQAMRGAAVQLQHVALLLLRGAFVCRPLFVAAGFVDLRWMAFFELQQHGQRIA